MDQEVLQVAAEDAGMRVDAFIAAKLGVSRARAQEILDGATVDGITVKAKHNLKEGSEVRWTPLAAPEIAALPNIPAEQLLTVADFLYEDEHLLVLNKRAGLTVHQGAGDTGATVVDLLRARGVPLSSVGPPERAGIVHRLDKDTTGLLIVCKTDAAHWKLASDFEERRVDKTYEAVVCAVPTPKGRIEAPIGRHHTYRKRMAVVPEGRMAVTEYEVVSDWLRFSHLKINLLTGRTHQIRVHLAYIGHPLAGDAVYGGAIRALTNSPDARVTAALEALPGQALHAAHLRFFHPVSGESIELDAPLPPVMRELIDALEADAENNRRAVAHTKLPPHLTHPQPRDSKNAW